MHTIKTQAHTLRTLLKARGLTLKHAEALELAAQANGYPNWQTAQAAERRPAAPPTPGPGTLYALHHDGSVWVYASDGTYLGFFAADGWDRDGALVAFTQRLLTLPPMGEVTVVHKSAWLLDRTPDDLSPGEYLDELLERRGPAFLAALPDRNGRSAGPLAVQAGLAAPDKASATLSRRDELLDDLTAAFREVYGPGAARVAVTVIRDENNRGYSTYDSWCVRDAQEQEIPVPWAFIEKHAPDLAAEYAGEAEYLADSEIQVEAQILAAEVAFDLGNALSHWIDDLHETCDFILTLN